MLNYFGVISENENNSSPPWSRSPAPAVGVSVGCAEGGEDDFSERQVPWKHRLRFSRHEASPWHDQTSLASERETPGRHRQCDKTTSHPRRGPKGAGPPRRGALADGKRGDPIHPLRLERQEAEAGPGELTRRQGVALWDVPIGFGGSWGHRPSSRAEQWLDSVSLPRRGCHAGASCLYPGLPERGGSRGGIDAEYARIFKVFRCDGIFSRRVDQLLQHSPRDRCRLQDRARVLPDSGRHTTRAICRTILAPVKPAGDHSRGEVLSVRCGGCRHHHRAEDPRGTRRALWQGLWAFHLHGARGACRVHRPGVSHPILANTGGAGGRFCPRRRWDRDRGERDRSRWSEGPPRSQSVRGWSQTPTLNHRLHRTRRTTHWRRHPHQTLAPIPGGPLVRRDHQLMQGDGSNPASRGAFPTSCSVGAGFIPARGWAGIQNWELRIRNDKQHRWTTPRDN